jgi:hypothetical protein
MINVFRSVLLTRYHSLDQPCNLRTPEHYHLGHNSQSFFLILRDMNPFIISHRISLRTIPALSSHLRLDRPSGLLPPKFPHKSQYAFFFPHIRATSPVHFIPLQLITVIKLDKMYTSQSSSLRSYLNSTVTISPSRPRKTPHHLLLKHHQPFIPLL